MISIARLNGSQLLADTVDPKTIAVAKKYKFIAMKPNAPTKSGAMRGYLKQALISAIPNKMSESG